MSEVPEVFDVFEKKLAQVLSFTLVTHPNSTKKAVEELLTYFSSVVERASKAESRIAELEEALSWKPKMNGFPRMESDERW